MLGGALGGIGNIAQRLLNPFAPRAPAVMPTPATAAATAAPTGAPNVGNAIAGLHPGYDKNIVATVASSPGTATPDQLNAAVTNPAFGGADPIRRANFLKGLAIKYASTYPEGAKLANDEADRLIQQNAPTETEKNFNWAQRMYQQKLAEWNAAHPSGKEPKDGSDPKPTPPDYEQFVGRADPTKQRDYEYVLDNPPPGIGKFNRDNADSMPDKDKAFYTQKYNEIFGKGPLVTMTGPNEAAKKLAELQAKPLESEIQAGESARTLLPNLAYAKDAIDQNGNWATYGPLGPAALRAKQALMGAFGFKDPSVAPSEVLEKLNAQMSAEQAKMINSRFTQREFGVFQQSTPGLKTTREGNYALIDIMSQIAQRNIEHQNIIARGRLSEKGDFADISDAIDKYDQEHPLISPFTKRPVLESLNQPAAAAAPAGGGQRPVVTSQKEYDAVPPDTDFVENGQIFHKGAAP